MKVFDIVTDYTFSQIHCVVAESMAEAEKLYNKEYPDSVIKEIKLYSEYVLIKKEEIMKTLKIITSTYAQENDEYLKLLKKFQKKGFLGFNIKKFYLIKRSK